MKFNTRYRLNYLSPAHQELLALIGVALCAVTITAFIYFCAMHNIDIIERF